MTQTTKCGQCFATVSVDKPDLLCYDCEKGMRDRLEKVKASKGWRPR